MRAVSFHGFAGSFAFALRDLGIELVAVVEPGGFGADMIEANREVLGFTGPIHTEKTAPSYDNIDIVLGNPPCSGFSRLNSSKSETGRGIGADVNSCMWALVNYAARCNGGKGPTTVIWESVQAAGKEGAPLMLELLAELRELTHEPYELTHLFMSGASVGSAQTRKRYFWVTSKLPFGIDPPVVERVTTIRDAIGDLVGLVPTNDPQPTQYRPSDWAEALTWEHEGEPWVTCHVGPDDQFTRMMAPLMPEWPIGVDSSEMIRRYFARTGQLPPGWRQQDAQRALDGKGFARCFRVHPDRPGRVIAGDGGYSCVHWEEDRIFTVREVARMMGFPDESRWDFTAPAKTFPLLGKQVPVQSWKWALSWVERSLLGKPGWYQGERDELRQVLTIDVTDDYKRVYNDRKGLHGVDSRSDDLKRRMEARTGA